MTHLTQVGVAATTKGETFSGENTFIFEESTSKKVFEESF